MSRRRHTKKSKGGDVELKLAAMLDMAFQLLTFFILTFRPAPTEGEVALRMPMPQPIGGGIKRVENPGERLSPITSDISSLVVSVSPNQSGGVGSMAIGETTVGSLASLARKLNTILSDSANPFEQVVIQAGSDLRYDALMDVINVCMRQKMSDGKPLTKLSFVENHQNIAVNSQ